MKYEYSTKVLNVYSQTERVSYQALASQLGMSGTAFYRYEQGVRLPAMDVLVHICNTLRISVSNFFLNPGQQLSTVMVYEEDSFKPVKFLPHNIETLRNRRGMSKETFIRFVEAKCGVNVSKQTYNKLVNGESFVYEFVVAVLNAFDLELSALFDDDQLQPVQSLDEKVTISRKSYEELQAYIRRLESKNSRLKAENTALKPKTLPLPSDLYRRIRATIGNIENLAETLRSILPESEAQPYNDNDFDTPYMIAADDGGEPYERKSPTE